VFKFRTTPRGFLPTVSDLRRTITSGISGTMMPAFTKLSESEVGAVIVYLKNLSPRWSDPKAAAKPVNIPEPPDYLVGGLDKSKHRKAGQQLFSAQCAACHGENGKGDGPASSNLKDVWENAITPADLTSPHHKSGGSLGDLYRTIALGLDGTPMVGFLEPLGEKKIWQLVAFIKSIEEHSPER
jgi:mono/diheme cytochrome c family protein